VVLTSTDKCQKSAAWLKRNPSRGWCDHNLFLLAKVSETTDAAVSASVAEAIVENNRSMTSPHQAVDQGAQLSLSRPFKSVLIHALLNVRSAESVLPQHLVQPDVKVVQGWSLVHTGTCK
jgi:hypothetical protein